MFLPREANGPLFSFSPGRLLSIFQWDFFFFRRTVMTLQTVVPLLSRPRKRSFLLHPNSHLPIPFTLSSFLLLVAFLFRTLSSPLGRLTQTPLSWSVKSFLHPRVSVPFAQLFRPPFVAALCGFVFFAHVPPSPFMSPCSTISPKEVASPLSFPFPSSPRFPRGNFLPPNFPSLHHLE